MHTCEKVVSALVSMDPAGSMARPAEAQQPYRIGRMEGSAHEIDVRRMGAEFSQALEHFTSAGHIELSSGSLCVSDRNVIAQMRAARQLRGSSDLATQRMSRVLSQICKQL